MEISKFERFRKAWRQAKKGARVNTRLVMFGGHGQRVAVLTHPKVCKGEDVPEGARKKRRCYVYNSVLGATKAAGGIDKVSFDTSESEIKRVVGESAGTYVCSAIRQIWPCHTEKQLRSLSFELENKRK